jgi:hypothetical protein
MSGPHGWIARMLWWLIGADSSRSFSENIEAVEALLGRREGQTDRVSFVHVVPGFILRWQGIASLHEIVELNDNVSPLVDGERWAFLGEMVDETFDPAFGKDVTACFASVLIAIGIIVEFGSPTEIVEDDLIWLTTHLDLAFLGPLSSMVSILEYLG